MSLQEEKNFTHIYVFFILSILNDAENPSKIWLQENWKGV